MTKKQILKKNTTPAETDGESFYDSTLEPIFESMDEYAKQESIAFLKWGINTGNISPNHNYKISLGGETTDKTYDLYLLSKDSLK